MPRYDYECETCHNRFEVKQSFSSEPVANCPVCQNGARRVIHSVPVVFKGSGFYVNDYGKGSNGARSNSESETEGKAKESKSGPKDKSGDAAKAESKDKSGAKAESKKKPAAAKK